MLLGFIIGVGLSFLPDISTGLKFAFPFYGAGIGLFIDNFLARRRNKP
ncbi:hypothetical protein [Microaerobacter geothermalis]|nr:hypothetical protein [Microaerobacter geothermalis]